MTKPYLIELGPDLLLGTTLALRSDAFSSAVATLNAQDINWWISSEENGPPIDVSLMATGTAGSVGYTGLIQGSAIVAHLSTFRHRSVWVSTAVGAQVVDVQQAIVIDP